MTKPYQDEIEEGLEEYKWVKDMPVCRTCGITAEDLYDRGGGGGLSKNGDCEACSAVWEAVYDAEDDLDLDWRTSY